jgi:hypothetical protein
LVHSKSYFISVVSQESSFIVQNLSGIYQKVLIVCDGNRRHHSKKSTTKRIIESHKLKREYHRLKSALTSGLSLPDETNKIKDRLKKLDKKISASSIDVGDKLFEETKMGIEKYSNEKQRNKQLIQEHLVVIQAEFQADSVIAYRMIHNISSLVLATDSDQAMHCGEACCCIKEYAISKNNSLERMSIFVATYETLKKTLGCINLPVTSEQIVVPKYPFLNIVSNPNVRALIAIGISCDIHIHGISSITANSIYHFITSDNKEHYQQECLYERMMTLFWKKRKNKTKTCQSLKLLNFDK